MPELDLYEAARLDDTPTPAPQNKPAEVRLVAMHEEVSLKAQRKTVAITDQKRSPGTTKTFPTTVEHSDVEFLDRRDQSPTSR
ncbi:hypothetical protein ABZY83_07740 [Streptomyces virginiae]|uniref:hypothetical protein n=1 Tax=Streptomyces TaxID=1883 RepID=UPI00131B7083|nr:hypothetical protein [Streptomyces sp. IGB124]